MKYDQHTQTLTVTKSGFCDILNSNPDKSKSNQDINGKLVLMIHQHGDNISPKQKTWVLHKLNFINRQRTNILNTITKRKQIKDINIS